jgi:hypothetical protein
MTVAFITYDEIAEIQKLSDRHETKRNLDLGLYTSMLAIESHCANEIQLLHLMVKRQKIFDALNREYDIQKELERELVKLRAKVPLCMSKAKMYKSDRLTDQEIEALKVMI